MWDETVEGISKHLITYTKNGDMSLIAERPDGLHRPLLAKMDHLVCFMPGTIALGATDGQPLSVAKQSSTWSRRQDEEILLAKELAKTCWATYLATATGLAPEITYFHTDNPPKMLSDVYPDSTLLGGGSSSSPSSGVDLKLISAPLEDTETWKQDIDIHPQDTHNLQRPETIESLLYMYRITGDDQYREWGWDMFKAFVKHTAVIQPVVDHSDPSSSSSSSAPSSRIVGFTSLSNGNFNPPVQRDNMESFWMAETLKYFYLLFSEPDFIPLQDVVLNTEAHIFPRFKTGGDLKTGWTRKPRVV
jgi:mannosyl-oligosaccharide alpha-1,2-mannosidase